MKLSEAILMGSKVVKPTPYIVLNKSSRGPRGCAFGMAFYAIGIKDDSELKCFGGSVECPAEWSWVKTPASNPHLCDCKDKSDIRLRTGDHLGYITHYFNEHVTKGKWTLEQLVDYVRSIEPAELPEYVPDPRDEEPWTDTMTAIEMRNSIKGR